MSVSAKTYFKEAKILQDNFRRNLSINFKKVEKQGINLNRKINHALKKRKKEAVSGLSTLKNNGEIDIGELKKITDQLRAVKNSKYTLLYFKSKLKLTTNTEVVDDILTEEIEFLRALSEISDLILPEETLKEYENKIDKLLKKSVLETRSSKRLSFLGKFSFRRSIKLY